MSEEQLRNELARAYRAIRGFYTAVQKAELPDSKMLSYHGLTIGAACRFVATGEMDGADYFVGKQVRVLHEALDGNNSAGKGA